MKISVQREKGVAAIEFAFVAPVLIALILGIVDFGFRFQTMATYDNAAQAAARSWTIDNSATTARAAAQNAGIPASVANSATFSFTGGATSCKTVVAGAYPNVTVTVHNAASPYLIKIFGQSFGVTGTAVARCTG